MPKAHDRGGWPTGEPIDRSQHVFEDWELRIDALSVLLNQKGINCRDESRQARETLTNEQYEGFSYYEKWAFAAERVLVNKGFITVEALDRKMADLG